MTHARPQRTGLLTLALLLGMIWTGAAAAAPRVVVTLQPVHGLAAAVMEGVADAELLLSPGESPHAYSLRPSDARALARADVLVWIGPNHERFLEGAVDQLARGAERITVSELDGILLRSGRSGVEPITEVENSDHASADHGHDHGDHAMDYHLWLDPRNAAVIVRHLASVLAREDPEHADVYERNAARTLERLETLDRKLEERMRPLSNRPYIVFHDAYQYFESRYGLEPMGSVTLNPEQPPGARHVRDLRRRIRDLDTHCIFREPQFDPALIEALTEGTGVGRGELDPIGVNVETGPEAYFELLEGLADAYEECLSDPG